MLLEKSPSDMSRFIQELLPSLLNALTDSADNVVLMNLQVRAGDSGGDGGRGKEERGRRGERRAERSFAGSAPPSLVFFFWSTCFL